MDTIARLAIVVDTALVSRPILRFGLNLYVPVNSYGHVGAVSLHNHNFSWASLTNQLLVLRAHTFDNN